MSRVLAGTRYLIILPVLGLLLAASVFFVLGGIGLFRQLIDIIALSVDTLTGAGKGVDQGEVIFEIVEFVHLFLVGTVLYITAAGLYQLFIKEIKFPRWLRIDTTEELETNLIGVTVVVLAVNFMGAVLVGETEELLQYGAGIALPIAALGLFLGLRAWSGKLGKETVEEEETWDKDAGGQDAKPHDEWAGTEGGG